MNRISNHTCDPKLFQKSVSFYRSCPAEEKIRYETLQENVKEFAEVGCGKCIVELFKAVVKVHRTDKEKEDALNWLIKITEDLPPPNFIKDEENSIVHLIYKMIHNNEQWDECDPVEWVMETQASEQNIKKRITKIEPLITLKDIFVEEKDWEKYISALEKTNTPLIDKNWNFIGKRRDHKGVICSWIYDLKRYSIIKQSINRSTLAAVLNKSFKGFDLSEHGRTLDRVSDLYTDEFKKDLIKLSGAPFPLR